MDPDPTAVPDLTRDDAGLILVGEWSARDAAEQRRAADAALGAWRTCPWPGGLLAHHCLLGEDGRTLVHYLQWTDPSAARAFAGTGKPRWIRAVDDAAPGITHHKATAYHRYRDTAPLPAPPPTGCLVAVTIDFAAPDPGRQRAWVDNVFAAAGTAAPAPRAGMLAAHFHLSLDGTRVLNLAEWTSAQAHRDALTTPSPGFRSQVRAFPGVTGNTTERYLPYGHVTAA